MMPPPGSDPQADAARLDAESIVRQLGEMSPDLKQRFVEDFATAFWSALRGYALPDAKNYVNMRFLHNGSEVTTDSAGTTVGLTGGKGQFDIVNFVNGTADIDSASNARQLNVHVGGGGADCMFDFLVSSCFTSLTNWAEGTQFTTLSGCTFLGYSTFGGVNTYINANSANGQAWTVYLCGTTTENVTMTNPGASWDTLHVYGNGADHSGISGTITFNNANGLTINWYDLSITTLTSTSSFAAPKFYRCGLTTITNSSIANGYIGLECHDCTITNITESATGGTWENLVIQGCTVSGSIQLGASVLASTLNFRCENNSFASGSRIKLSTPTGGIISGNEFYGTGTPTTANIELTGNTAPLLGLEIEGNHFAGGITTAPLLFSTGNIYAEAAIVGNTFDYVSGINYIKGGSSTRLCCTITGNNFRANDDTPTYLETGGGISISGKFINSSFGLNTPSNFNLELLTGSSNNVYIGNGTISGAGASSATNIYALASSSYVTIAADSNLSAERVLTAGTGVTITDGGANSTVTVAASTNQLLSGVEVIIDGGGSAITTGVKADIRFPYACTITANTLMADQSGSIVLDLWKDTLANFPPTVADTITASAKPTLSSADNAEDTTLTGWTTSVAAGDVIRVNVDSASTVTRVGLLLKVSKT